METNNYTDEANIKLDNLKEKITKCDSSFGSSVIDVREAYIKAFSYDEISDSKLDTQLDIIDSLIKNFGKNCNCSRR